MYDMRTSTVFPEVKLPVHSTTTVEIGDIVANPRVVETVQPVIDYIKGHLRDRRVDYDEWHKAIKFVLETAKSGELPLLMDVFFEHVVDDNTNTHTASTSSNVEGPYYVPDAPMLSNPGMMPMRPDEPGESLVFCGQVLSADGTPIGGAMVDVWHADATVPGSYSIVHEGQPHYNLRGRLVADDEGRFELRTIKPAPYPIPDQGPTGRLLNLLGRHSWRPAHIHVKVKADGYRPLTTQVYFVGGEFLDSDSAEAVKHDLIVALEHQAAEGHSHYLLRQDFRLARQSG